MESPPAYAPRPFMEPRDPRIEATVSEALQQTSEEAREAFIQRTCGADDTLQRYVREMLAARDSSADDEVLSPEIEAELARLKPEESGDSIGQYKLLERLGEGGCESWREVGDCSPLADPQSRSSARYRRP